MLAGLVLALAGIAVLMISGRFVPRVSAQERAMPDAVPVDPVAAIAEAFRTHALVALADAHGNEQQQAFRLALTGTRASPASSPTSSSSSARRATRT